MTDESLPTWEQITDALGDGMRAEEALRFIRDRLDDKWGSPDEDPKADILRCVARGLGETTEPLN